MEEINFQKKRWEKESGCAEEMQIAPWNGFLSPGVDTGYEEIENGIFISVLFFPDWGNERGLKNNRIKGKEVIKWRG